MAKNKGSTKCNHSSVYAILSIVIDEEKGKIFSPMSDKI